MIKAEKYSKQIIVILVSIVMFMEFLDTTIINTAIPSIARSFHQDPLLLKFSATSYFLSLAIFTPVSGWVADKIGTKRIFILSISLFVISSLLCGLATNILELTCFRFLQGMGGAFMNPVSRIVILRIFQPKDLVRVQGYIFTPAMLGFVFGPFLGGLITTYLNWSWIFFINIPIGLLTIYFGFYFIPQQKGGLPKKFDLLGFVLSAVALGCIAFSVDMIGHYEYVPKSIVFFCGIIGLICFLNLIFYCKRKSNPILDFSLFAVRTFRIGLLSNFTMYMITASISFLLPLMYQEHFLYSPVYSGILVLPIAFGQFIFRLIAPKIIHNLGFKTSMLMSCTLIILSIFFLSEIQKHSSIYYIIFAEFLCGSSLIIYGSSTGALNYIDVPKELSSKATALDLTSRQFSASLGIGITALFINFFRHSFGLDFSSAGGIKIFHYTFLIIASLCFFSLFQSMKLQRNEGNHALVK